MAKKEKTKPVKVIFNLPKVPRVLPEKLVEEKMLRMPPPYGPKEGRDTRPLSKKGK